MGFKKQIIINKDTVFRVKVEEINEFRDSFFYDTYLAAAKIVVDIINNTKGSNYKDSSNTYSVETDINNIIAFVGERGSGKTSVMASFAKSLKEKNKLENNSSEFYEIYSKLRNENFLVESIIDPSIFTVKDSIIEIILAKMFNNFKNEIEQDDDIIKKQNLIRCFEKVYKDLRMINREKNKFYDENEDNLEVLLDLSSAISLKENFKELVKEYLKFMKKSKLVIPIDDLDMRLDSASNMIEEIRKYLMQDDIIILMAIKFEQLDQILKEKNLQQYNILLKNYNERIIKNDIALKIEKYLEKIIPVNRRLYLPRIGINDVDIKFELNSSNYNSNLEHLIYDLIKEKTLVEFNIDDINQYLIPNNLRGLIDFIVFLDSLEDINNNQSIITKNINKLIIFIGNRFKNITSKETNKIFIDELIKVPYQFINQKIIQYLGNLILNSIPNKDEDRDANSENIIKYLKECCSSQVNYRNLSIGYVNQVVNLFYKMLNEESDKIFAVYIRFIYMLRLNELLYEDEIGTGIIKIKKIIAGDIYGNCFKLYEKMLNINKVETSVKVFKYKGAKLFDNLKNNDLKANNFENFADIASMIDKEFNDNGLINNRIFDVYTLDEENYLNSLKNNYIFKPMNIVNKYIYFEEYVGKLIEFALDQLTKDHINIPKNYIKDAINYQKNKYLGNYSEEEEEKLFNNITIKNLVYKKKKYSYYEENKELCEEIDSYIKLIEKIDIIRIKYIKKIINIDNLSKKIDELLNHLGKYSMNHPMSDNKYLWYLNMANKYILDISDKSLSEFLKENISIDTEKYLGKYNKENSFQGIGKNVLNKLLYEIIETRYYIEENKEKVKGITMNNNIYNRLVAKNRMSNDNGVKNLIDNLKIRMELLKFDNKSDKYKEIIAEILNILDIAIKEIKDLLGE
ncbi:hypothetical protein [Clostridium baratii]|uniref:hypothetical protein n=1 Tax=Clostridium baratii TaxID=1561 RepID=UPI0030CFC78E